MPHLASIDVTAIEARSPLELFWRRFREDKRRARGSLGFIVLLILVAIAAPLVVELVGAPGPNVQNSKALDAFGSPRAERAHPSASTTLGRDVFSRVIYGARVSLEVAILATAIATVVGIDRGPAGGLLPRLGRHDPLALVDVLLAFPICCSALGLGLGLRAGKAASAALLQPGLATS